jgi:hypothetical protein
MGPVVPCSVVEDQVASYGQERDAYKVGMTGTATHEG